VFVLRKRYPPQDALDHIAFAISDMLKVIPELGHAPARADIEFLSEVCNALDYAMVVAEALKRELEGRLQGEPDNRMQ
jgi:hypothetical protein